MFGISPFLRKLLVFLLYLVLQASALVLLINNSYFQQNAMMRIVRNSELYFWEKRSDWRSFLNLKKTNDALNAENSRLLNELAKFYQLQDEWKAKDTILPAVSDSFSFIPAVVLNNSVTRQQNFLIINKGLADGVTPDLGVISNTGIVGIVSNVTEHYAVVISLLNTEQRLTALLSGSQVFGTLRWDGSDYSKVRLTEIPRHIPVAIGDTVISSDFSVLFPPRIPIGTVSSFSTKKGTFLDLEVDLFLDFKTLRYVNVVTHSGVKEIKEL